MVMRCCNVIHSAVIIHAATTSLNESKNSILLFFIINCIITCGELMMGFQEALRILRRRPHGTALKETNLHVQPVRSVFKIKIDLFWHLLTDNTGHSLAVADTTGKWYLERYTIYTLW